MKIKSFVSMAVVAIAITGSAFNTHETFAAQSQVVQIEVKQVSSFNFKQEVENSNLPVIVDFSAVWCGPCQSLAPNLEKIAAEFGGKVKVVKVDVDTSGDLTARFGVNRFPTMITFKNGQRQETMIGCRSIEQLRATCNSLLK